MRVPQEEHLPLCQPADHGDVFIPADGMTARWAAGGWLGGAEGGRPLRSRLGFGSWLGIGQAQNGPGLGLPLLLHHLGHAVDDHVEEAAHAQAQDAQPQGVSTTLVRNDHSKSTSMSDQTTWPSLKMGRYIDTTMPPMMVPRITMMKGSIRLDNAP